MSPHALAKSWLERGAKVLPLRGNKAPVPHLVPRGFLDATGDFDKLWWFEHEDTELVGIVPGSMGFVVLDVDVKGAIDGRRELAMMEVTTSPQGRIDRSVTVRTRSGGEHIYLRKRGNQEIGNTDLCKGVNVRSDHGYVVAPGNPGYELDFNWPRYRDIPFPPGLLWEKLTAPVVYGASADYGEVEEHVEDEWHEKVQAAFALFEAYGDRHTSMLTAVNALASYELLGYAGSTAALWALEEEFISAVEDRSSDHEAKLEYRRSLDGARKRVRENESTVLEEQRKDREFAELIKANGGGEDDVAVLQAIAESTLKMWSMRELRESDLTVRWLVRNVLITPTYGQIAGESKTLKTYLSQFLALAVATGEPFLGQFPVERTGPVVFFVGEGGRIPWTRRLPRCGAAVGVNNVWDAPIYASFETAPLLSQRFKDTVHEVLDRINPVLTIIDPYYAYHGADIESANLHAEGALLTATAAPFIEHGSTLLICNHFNKATSGRSVKRITMSGSGEWVDSWWFTEQRGEPDLNAGDFPITVEFGSRQWGGAKWDLDINIGRPSSMGTESDDPIMLSVRQSWD